MSLEVACMSCYCFSPIGRLNDAGICSRCQQKKARFAAEIAATYPKHKCMKHGLSTCEECSIAEGTSAKPKCPVFGCTIPRGIPHEHPAGVSVVMRDPVAPLNADERAELEAHRRMNAIRMNADEQKRQHEAYLYAQAHQNAWGLFGLGQKHPQGMAASQMHAEEQRARNMRDEALFHIAAMTPTVYLVPADAPIHAGRKLRDVLLMAGTSSMVGSTATVDGVEIITEATCGPAPKNLDQRHDWNGIKMHIAEPATRRTLAQSVGKLMAWMFGIPALLLAAFAIGTYCGWWV